MNSSLRSFPRPAKKPTREALLAALAERDRELAEARRREAATAEVLKVISRSAFNLDAVTTTILRSALELCNATIGTLHLRDGDMLWLKLQLGFSRKFEEFSRQNPIPVRYPLHSRRAMRPGDFAHYPDVEADPDYLYRTAAKLGGYRAVIVVPMTRENELVGLFSLGRGEPGPFTPSQISLVQTFADQAVIAIENARLFDEVQARTRDLSEALRFQTSSSEVLKVISKSPNSLQPVLDVIVETTRQLCGTDTSTVWMLVDGKYRLAAESGSEPTYLDYLRAHPITIEQRGSSTSRAAREKRTVHIPDITRDPEYGEGPMGVGAGRALLSVPLLRAGTAVGVVTMVQSHGHPFNARQIDAVETFADQALIAIENTRLFNETQEALERQTATASVLKAISRSVSDATPVFETILESCQRLFGLEAVAVYLVEGDMVRGVANRGWDEGDWGRDTTPLAGSTTGLAIAERHAVHFPDLADRPELPEKFRRPIREGGGMSVLYAPMLTEDRGVGSIVVSRKPAKPFSEREIALIQTFADQAVVAIQNARLFAEVRDKTRDLTEALQQQTATAEVLKVISRSAFDLDNVLNSLTKSAVELCNATYGAISLYKDGVLVFMAQTGCTPEFAELLWSHPARLDRKSVTGRTGLLRTVVMVPDVTKDEDYDYHGGEIIGNYRSCMGVPLLRKGELEGVFTLMRGEPGTFTARQVELVQTFADQAVIAIENVRLFDEVQARTRDLSEALQLQTATSDVLKVISRSTFDLQTVFNTLVTSAVDLTGATTGSICVREGDAYRFRHSSGASVSPALAQYLRDHPATPGRGTMAGRVLLSGKVERIADVREDPEYVVPMQSLGDPARSILGVPLLKKGGAEGALVLTRSRPGNFTDRQIEIVQTFADQAVIAIENMRLFDEVQARTKELAVSLDELRRAQDRLVQSEKLASLGQLTAGIAHEIKNPLNFVNNFSALSRELIDELREALASAPLDKAQRDETEELIGMVASNLDKVVQHGKRADSIVKNMLLHSREGSGDRSSVNVNVMVEEALNLAYHGARAERPGFNVTIDKSLDPRAGDADLYAQEMTRVLLNLISNGFYATTKRGQGEPSGAYEPTITASTRDLGDRVEIAIRDNGTGIPDEVKAKMFNPFFTTKPAGEGTGLGLSLSHDIVVKQHGGTLEVSTEPGAYTQFTIVLPRAGAAS